MQSSLGGDGALCGSYNWPAFGRLALPLMLLTLVAGYFDESANAKEALSSELVSSIQVGHKLLAENVQQVRGSVTRWVVRSHLQPSAELHPSDAFSKEDLKQNLFAEFMVSGSRFRLEYLDGKNLQKAQPKLESLRKGFHEVLVQTPKTAMHYNASSTTGVPHATLFRYADPLCLEVDLRLSTDLKNPLRVLMGSGISVLDLLQRMEFSVEYKPHLLIVDALHMKAKKLLDGDQTLRYQIVLDPNRNYAMREFKSSFTTQGATTSSEVIIQLAKGAEAMTVPGEIAIVVQTANSEGLVPAKCYREVINLDIVPLDVPADKKNFSTKSFAELERDYTLVEVGRDDSKVVGETINAAPLEARFPGVSSSDIRGKSSKQFFWIFANGVVVFFLAAIILYRRHYLRR